MKATLGQQCNNLNIEVSSEDECELAANQLGLEFAKSWNGPGDFPACLYAKEHTNADKRNKVFYNSSPNPGRTNLNSNYAAICRSKGSIRIEMLYERTDSGFSFSLHS